jgi:hypothetical protein
MYVHNNNWTGQLTDETSQLATLLSWDNIVEVTVKDTVCTFLRKVTYPSLGMYSFTL